MDRVICILCLCDVRDSRELVKSHNNEREKRTHTQRLKDFMKVFYDFSAVESSNIRANCWLSSKFLPQFNYFGVYIASAVCHLFVARISFVNMFQQQTLLSLNSKCIWCMWKFCFRTSVMHKFPNLLVLARDLV